MIGFLEGTLDESLPTHVVINVQGVGYHALIPLSSFDRLPAVGARVRILTHLHVREDALTLYGFHSAAERDLFRLLLHHVTGIGPKLALAVLSGMSVESFKAAVVGADAVAISRISGVGKKTADRVILELKDKVGVAATWEAASLARSGGTDPAAGDAELALISLGYKQVEAHRAVAAAIKESGGGAMESADLVREALKRLA